MEPKWNRRDQNNPKHVLGQIYMWYRGYVFIEVSEVSTACALQGEFGAYYGLQ